MQLKCTSVENKYCKHEKCNLRTIAGRFSKERDFSVIWLFIILKVQKKP